MTPDPVEPATIADELRVRSGSERRGPPYLRSPRDARARLRERGSDARADASSASRRERRSRSEPRDLRKELSSTLDQVAMSSFEAAGTFVVNKDVLPCTYRAAASPGCYWETGRGSGSDTIANDNADGPVIVQSRPRPSR